MNKSKSIWIAGLIAIIFGLMTLKEGGLVLFGPAAHAEAAGNYVPFVLRFNFIAGVFYIFAGICLLRRKARGRWLALAISISTLVVFALFFLHILNGGAHETRTVVAMSLRSGIWVVITLFYFYKVKQGSHPQSPDNP